MLKYILAFATLALSASPALAHPDHDIDEPEDRPAEQIAREHLIRQVAQAKLAASWSKAKPQPTQTHRVRGQTQTVVAFRNDSEPQARRMFYVVLNSNGAVLTSSHSLN